MSFKKTTNCTAALPVEAFPTHCQLHTESTHNSQFGWKIRNLKLTYYHACSLINYKMTVENKVK